MALPKIFLTKANEPLGKQKQEQTRIVWYQLSLSIMILPIPYFCASVNSSLIFPLPRHPAFSK